MNKSSIRALALGVALSSLAAVPVFAQVPQPVPPGAAVQSEQLDPPGRVGRLSLAEGNVSLSTADSEPAPVGMNWSVTAQNKLQVGKNSRAELRVGSTVVQVNADSALEIAELNDEQFFLRLNYGSISVQVKNPEVMAGLFVRTPHGQIHFTEPGRVRIDADVAPDTTAVNVFAGEVQFEGAGSNLRLKAGKRVEAGPDNVRTQQATRDMFDDWSASRDQVAYVDARSPAARYVSPETTGYEELDRHGDWQQTDEYGPVWTPRNVAADWAPYRDGRWTWVAPWGWTWVDNAPWGYAPSHYGRWVTIGTRWYWAPGRVVARPVWAPALVGWVGGGNWSMSFSSGSGPAVGWFPLAPREAYVPYYRVSSRYVEHLNYGHYWRNAPARGYVYAAPATYRHSGAVIVVPQQNFHRGSAVIVSPQSRIIVGRDQLRNAPREMDRGFLEGRYRQQERREEARRDDRRDDRRDEARRDDRRRDDRRGDDRRRDFGAQPNNLQPRQVQPAAVQSAPQAPAQSVQPVMQATPRSDNDGDRNERRSRRFGDGADQRSVQPAATPSAAQAAPASAAQSAAPSAMPHRMERNDRNERREENRPAREPREQRSERTVQPAAQQAPQQPQQQAQQPSRQEQNADRGKRNREADKDNNGR